MPRKKYAVLRCTEPEEITITKEFLDLLRRAMLLALQEMGELAAGVIF